MEYLVFAGLILFLILLFMGNGYLEYRRRQKKFIKKLREQYGDPIERTYAPGELEQHIPMYYRKHEKPHQIDDITWNDLNMDEVYRTINTSLCAAGDEYLYYRLRTPMQDEGELEQFERQIKYFMEHEEERVKLQVQFSGLGRISKHSIYEYLDYLDTLGERNNIKYYLAILFVFLGIGALFLSVSTGIVLLLIVICLNMVNYYREQSEIEPYLTSFRYISRLMETAQCIGKLSVEAAREERERLMSCCKKMEGFKRNSFLVLSNSTGRSDGNPLMLLLDYLRMIFYLDLIKFNQMLRTVRDHLSEIDEMVTMIGRLEAVIVVGAYRTGRQEGYCIPEFLSVSEQTERKINNDCYLKIEQLYHPLLRMPVKNDIEVNKGVLLTGSNASGKSTFLRAVALNAILAQTIHTCLADSYQGCMFRIYSSMSLKDDLVSGDSYYMVEIKSIKRILERVEEAEKDKKQVLCFVDEVLRGTNTVERIAASTQILRKLAREHAICFAATHDVELTKLLEDVYDNYHFEEEIEKEDIFFPYRLRKGPATSRNAIALLKMLGYEKSLTEDAEEMADTFLRTGKWERERVDI